jgi:two-component system aerobic respiration control sensor histidine kinase ArcB
MQQNENDTSSYSKDLPQQEKELFELTQYPLLDIEVAKKIGNSEETIQRLLKFMIDKQIVMDDVKKMTVAHDDNDWVKVQELAHKIKSGAIYIGTVRMKMACQYLERYWKVGKRDALEKLYQQALTVIDDTHQAVMDWLKR